MPADTCVSVQSLGRRAMESQKLPAERNSRWKIRRAMDVGDLPAKILISSD